VQQLVLSVCEFRQQLLNELTVDIWHAGSLDSIYRSNSTANVIANYCLNLPVAIVVRKQDTSMSRRIFDECSHQRLDVYAAAAWSSLPETAVAVVKLSARLTSAAGYISTHLRQLFFSYQSSTRHQRADNWQPVLITDV